MKLKCKAQDLKARLTEAWLEERKPLEIKWAPPSWQLIGDLAIDQLKQGHTDYALGVIPMMVEKLVSLEAYANEDGKLSVNKPNDGLDK